MSRMFNGVGGAPGIAIGRAFRFIEATTITEPTGETVDAALERFTAAQAAAAERLNQVAESQRAAGHEDEAGIFDFQSLTAEDPTLTDEVTRLLHEGQPLSKALDAAIVALRESIAALDDPYLRDRAADIDAVGKEIRKALAGGGAAPTNVPADAIIVAADLTPAETVELPTNVAGFATAYGGPTAHTVILARSRGIPAAVGLGADLLAIEDGTPLILDGDHAQLLIDPSAEEQTDYQQKVDQQRQIDARRATLHDQPGRLKDGKRVELWANIGRPEEAELALKYGAEGIGLFRTEFLFLDRSSAPTEEEQFTAYRTVLETMEKRPVVVRTIDIGGDKPIPYLDLPHEANPFLGVRGLRLCMQRPDLFRTQLRALLRAAVYGNLWIMLPMISTPEDLAWGREQLTQTASELAAAGIEHRADPLLGIMIETPAAAVTADIFASQAAFFSVGSNDLAQYTLAVDRGMAELATRYPHDAKAVWRLIDRAASAAHATGIPMGICGELGGEPEAAVILAGMGVTELSMAPARIPAVKERLLQSTLIDAQAVAQQVLT